MTLRSIFSWFFGLFRRKRKDKDAQRDLYPLW